MIQPGDHAWYNGRKIFIKEIKDGAHYFVSADDPESEVKVTREKLFNGGLLFEATLFSPVAH